MGRRPERVAADRHVPRNVPVHADHDANGREHRGVRVPQPRSCGRLRDDTGPIFGNRADERRHEVTGSRRSALPITLNYAAGREAVPSAVVGSMTAHITRATEERAYLATRRR